MQAPPSPATTDAKKLRVGQSIHSNPVHHGNSIQQQMAMQEGYSRFVELQLQVDFLRDRCFADEPMFDEFHSSVASAIEFACSLHWALGDPLTTLWDLVPMHLTESEARHSLHYFSFVRAPDRGHKPRAKIFAEKTSGAKLLQNFSVTLAGRSLSPVHHCEDHDFTPLPLVPSSPIGGDKDDDASMLDFGDTQHDEDMPCFPSPPPPHEPDEPHEDEKSIASSSFIHPVTPDVKHMKILKLPPKKKQVNAKHAVGAKLTPKMSVGGCATGLCAALPANAAANLALPSLATCASLCGIADPIVPELVCYLEQYKPRRSFTLIPECGLFLDQDHALKAAELYHGIPNKNAVAETGGKKHSRPFRCCVPGCALRFRLVHHKLPAGVVKDSTGPIDVWAVERRKDGARSAHTQEACRELMMNPQIGKVLKKMRRQQNRDERLARKEAEARGLEWGQEKKKPFAAPIKCINGAPPMFLVAGRGGNQSDLLSSLPAQKDKAGNLALLKELKELQQKHMPPEFVAAPEQKQSTPMQEGEDHKNAVKANEGMPEENDIKNPTKPDAPGELKKQLQDSGDLKKTNAHVERTTPPRVKINKLPIPTKLPTSKRG